MTQNQLTYMRQLEDHRANLANEELTKKRDAATKQWQRDQLEETKRSNLARESLTGSQLAEAGRHNLATEQHALLQLSETQRANKAAEAWRAESLVETRRSNLAREEVTRFSAQEQARANRAREAETRRSNLASESLEQQRINLGYSQLDETKRQNSAANQLRSNELIELHRANVARESEQTRANQARESEQSRHNQVSELHEGYRLDLGYDELGERRRHNIVTEVKGYLDSAIDYFD